MVGLLIHVAVDGFDHVPGLGHAPTLLGLLASSIVLAAVGGFLASAFGLGPPPIATKRANVAYLAALALAGFSAYALLELSEGNGVDNALQALGASLPAALLVSRVFRAIRSLVRAAGTAFAAFARGRHSETGATFERPVGGALRSPSASVERAHRGRAPPLLA
jgi:ABC-type Co2+ transport system permease subunit